MTVLFGPTDFTQTANADVGQPGAAPVGAGAMTGNPASSSYKPFGCLVPAPQVGGAGQTLNAPLVNDGIARGNVPLNAQPTNINNGVGIAGAGTDSLLAQISRGQLSLNQSNYGQSHTVPKDAGTGPQSQPFAEPQPQPTGNGGAVTVPAQTNYTGN